MTIADEDAEPDRADLLETLDTAPWRIEAVREDEQKGG